MGLWVTVMLSYAMLDFYHPSKNSSKVKIVGLIVATRYNLMD
jgi:hypothetical protein